MMSFDVKLLFTSIALSKAIEITLERVYYPKEINADILKTIIKEKLLLWTKDVRFLFEDEIYQQIEMFIRSNTCWYFHFGLFVKTDIVNEILLKLTSFHINIQFRYEAESNNSPSFSDILVIRNNSIETVYRKPTNSEIYLNWNLLSPKSWKRGTSRTIIKRTYVVCLTTDLLQKEVDHISFVFLNYNNVPNWLIDQYYVKRRKTTTLFEVYNQK